LFAAAFNGLLQQNLPIAEVMPTRDQGVAKRRLH
jgi:hypothetical protein